MNIYKFTRYHLTYRSVYSDFIAIANSEESLHNLFTSFEYYTAEIELIGEYIGKETIEQILMSEDNE